jgi:hypothetical protein
VKTTHSTIAENENYIGYFGVGNNMGYSDQYAVYVKLLNASDIFSDESSSVQ